MISVESVVGRQGIYRAHELIGYELLFRGAVSRGERPTGGQMTAEVIFSALDIGLDVLVGDKLLFCNAERSVLTGEVPVLLPPDRTIIEVLESVVVDDAIESGVAKLVEAGYRIALDDFTVGAKTASLLPYASFVKIDLLLTSTEELPGLVRMCREFDVELLAEKVQDPEQLPALADLGFTLFQGFALERPKLITGHSLGRTDVARLRSAVDIAGPGQDFDSYEELLRRDPALAHQIMRLASFGRPGETRRVVGSVRNALVVAGVDAVRRWLTLLLARPATTQGRSEALMNVLIRARTCELLAADIDGASGDVAFTAGLLSALDEVLEMAPADIAVQLALSAELQDAAFGGTNALGRLVLDVADHRYRGGVSGRTRSGLPAYRLDEAFADAFSWAFDTLATVA